MGSSGSIGWPKCGAKYQVNSINGPPYATRSSMTSTAVSVVQVLR